MGGTLDGDGLHWLDRFGNLYAAAGVAVSRETLRAAFDEAERQASTDEAISRAPLGEMVDRHLSWQFDYLGLADAALRRNLVERFVDPIRQAARANVVTLAALRDRGFALGVVSNGCGNVDVLCDDLGYASYFSVVVDSRRVGLFKPDPAIYRHAAARLGLPPAAIMMVGDSFDRDVLPAKSVGMRTAWLQSPLQAAGAQGRACPDPGAVDLFLQSLDELPARLSASERTVA
jgi:putative hydrolase of the HAD superfamily